MNTHQPNSEYADDRRKKSDEEINAFIDGTLKNPDPGFALSDSFSAKMADRAIPRKAPAPAQERTTWMYVLMAIAVLVFTAAFLVFQPKVEFSDQVGAYLNYILLGAGLLAVIQLLDFHLVKRRSWQEETGGI